MSNLNVSLTALSPLDGRYQPQLLPVATLFSEFSLISRRLEVEIAYLQFLSQQHIISRLTPQQELILNKIRTDFDVDDAVEVKKIEQQTKHDVKAIEYYLRDQLKAHDVQLDHFIHLGLTSEDTNSMAIALQLTEFKSTILIPKIKEVLSTLALVAEKHKSTVLMARTHGQPAVPTTVGKEFVVFAYRIFEEIKILEACLFEAKMSGAVGNFNAQLQMSPETDWIKSSQEFIASLGLVPALYTTQIVSPESYLRFFNSLQRINGILIDLCQDFWRYISDGSLIQQSDKNQVGSSTMPQKINPIDFENCEGNLGFSNAQLQFFSQKLAISRLQRDLSDSTVKRNFGAALGYSVLGYQSLIRGLSNIDVNVEYVTAEVNQHWELVAEAIQVELRMAGDSTGYEKLRIFTQGKKITQSNVEHFIGTLKVDEKIKQKLRETLPTTYIGLAPVLVDQALFSINQYLQGDT